MCKLLKIQGRFQKNLKNYKYYFFSKYFSMSGWLQNLSICFEVKVRNPPSVPSLLRRSSDSIRIGDYVFKFRIRKSHFSQKNKNFFSSIFHCINLTILWGKSFVAEFEPCLLQKIGLRCWLIWRDPFYDFILSTTSGHLTQIRIPVWSKWTDMIQMDRWGSRKKLMGFWYELHSLEFD